MTPNTPLPPGAPDWVDELLADVAIRVQLSRTDFNKAVERYGAIDRWIERDDSRLRGRVECFYPQGSMAIGATIASRLQTDEFDIDVVAGLNMPPHTLPDRMLDLLCHEIKGPPGSRYHRVTRRRTRCVTVEYADGMHIDVTPAVRLANTPEKESLIFHHRSETPPAQGKSLVANPYGFAEWFKSCTPLEEGFSKMFADREYAYEAQISAAATEPVPPQEPAHKKSTALIVLQLLKRWRNIRYDSRPERRPPSVLLSEFVARNAGSGGRLSMELLEQSRRMLEFFRDAQDRGELVYAANPVCARDVLTDRWPLTLANQSVFLGDLESLVACVRRLISGIDLDEMRQLMTGLFGETPTSGAVEEFARRTGPRIRDGQSRHNPIGGRLILPSAAGGAAATTPSMSRATPSHRFYGGERQQ